MPSDRKVPNDIVAFVQDCVRRRRVYWTYHVNMRLVRRFISRQAILEAVDTYELIESYPDDKYLPSCLVFAQHATDCSHVLFGIDVEGDNVRVVTSYRPDPSEWENFRKRRSIP